MLEFQEITDLNCRTIWHASLWRLPPQTALSPYLLSGLHKLLSLRISYRAGIPCSRAVGCCCYCSLSPLDRHQRQCQWQSLSQSLKVPPGQQPARLV
jgi:hypothetical protein